MASPLLQSLSIRTYRVSITIPASGGTAVTLQSLIVAALNAREEGLGDKLAPWIIGGRISAPATAYNAGDTAASQPLAIGTSSVFEEPALDFLKTTYVKSSAGSVAVVASVYVDRVA